MSFVWGLLIFSVLGLVLRAVGASASREVAVAAAPLADRIGDGSGRPGWKGEFAKRLAGRGASISAISDPLDAVTATREGALRRDVVILVEHDVFDAHHERLEAWLIKLAREGRPRAFRQKLNCTVCLVVGGPDAVEALPEARLKRGNFGGPWHVVVTAFDTSTNTLSEMPARARVVSVDVLAAMQEAATALALAAPSRAENNSSDELKSCPECAEQIRRAARKCRFCGYQFPEALALREQVTETDTQEPTTDEADTQEPTAAETDSQIEPEGRDEASAPVDAPSVAREYAESGRPFGPEAATRPSVDTSEVKIIIGVVVGIGIIAALVIGLSGTSKPHGVIDHPTSHPDDLPNSRVPEPAASSTRPKKRHHYAAPASTADPETLEPGQAVENSQAGDWTRRLHDQTEGGCVASGNSESACHCLTQHLETNLPYEAYREWLTRRSGSSRNFASALDGCRGIAEVLSFKLSHGPGESVYSCDTKTLSQLTVADVVDLFASGGHDEKVKGLLRRQCKWRDPFTQ